MLLTSATNFSIARFFGKVSTQTLSKPLQATGPMVAPMTISGSDAVDVEPKVMKPQANQDVDVGQVDKDVSENLCSNTHLVEAKEPKRQDMQGNQLQNVLEKNPWISERISKLQAMKFSDPDTIPLFRELDFA